MKDKIKELINPTPEQKYQKMLNQFRKDHIPERYNQVKLLDELTNPDIDHFISISNRTDENHLTIFMLCYILLLNMT